MRFCANCRREVPAALAKDPREDPLCGTCLRAVQKACPHALMKEDGITCRDCDARPVTFARVGRWILGGFKIAVGGFFRIFMMYTVPSAIGSLVLAGLAYLAGRKAGFF